jgi:hypothetical protein
MLSVRGEWGDVEIGGCGEVAERLYSGVVAEPGRVVETCLRFPTRGPARDHAAVWIE